MKKTTSFTRRVLPVAALVLFQIPGVFARGEQGRPHRAWRDTRIEQIERDDTTSNRVRVLVRFRSESARTLGMLTRRGVHLRRHHAGVGKWAIDVFARDLAWLESLPDVAEVTVDADVTAAADGPSSNRGSNVSSHGGPAAGSGVPRTGRRAAPGFAAAHSPGVIGRLALRHYAHV